MWEVRALLAHRPPQLQQLPGARQPHGNNSQSPSPHPQRRCLLLVRASWKVQGAATARNAVLSGDKPPTDSVARPTLRAKTVTTEAWRAIKLHFYTITGLILKNFNYFLELWPS